MDDKTYSKVNCWTLPGQQFYTILKGTKPDILLRAIKIKKFGKPPVCVVSRLSHLPQTET